MKSKPFKISVVIILSVMIVLTAFILYLPHYINHRISEAVNSGTEFHLDITTVSLTGFRSIRLDDIILQHKLNKLEYIKSKDYQTDWISCSLRSLEISGIDWWNLVTARTFNVKLIVLNEPDLMVYRDKSVPSRYAYKALPSQLLRLAETIFTIKLIELHNGKIVYEELSDQTGKTFKVPIHHLDAEIRNISSDKSYIDQQPVMSIEAKGIVFDSAETSISYTSNTLDTNNSFSFNGHISRFSATMLNKCLVPAGNLRVDDGIVRDVRFSFNADEHESNGTIRMDYHDLKIALLKNEKSIHKSIEKNTLKSLAVNLFIRKKDKKELIQHPSSTSGLQFQTGEIHYKRRKDRFIFNYWWNSFKSGIVNTIVKVPTP